MEKARERTIEDKVDAVEAEFDECLRSLNGIVETSAQVGESLASDDGAGQGFGEDEDSLVTEMDTLRKRARTTSQIAAATKMDAGDRRR